MESYFQIAAIDPGKNNFAFTVMRFRMDVVSEISLPKKKDRYLGTGEPSPAFLQALNELWQCPFEIAALENVKLVTDDKGTHVGNSTLCSLTRLLDAYTSLWDTCNVILIEKQMGFGKAHNTLGLRIAQHCLSYFLIRYDQFKDIIEYAAYNKTQVLGAPKGMSKPERKKWAVQQAKSILELKDERFLAKWSTFKKKDDVSDCICMCFSYIIGDVLS